MTREEVKDLLPVLQAYADGKTIQLREDNGVWIDVDNPDVESMYSYRECYRIKPSPTYRPFANAEECWNEMLKHQPVGWVCHKDCNSKIIIRTIDKDAVFTSLGYSFNDAFDELTFIDGSVFGVKEESEG